MLGDIYARRGKFKEAAQLYQKAGLESKALAMYTDLRMFNLAQVRFFYLLSYYVFVPLCILFTRTTWTPVTMTH